MLNRYRLFSTSARLTSNGVIVGFHPSTGIKDVRPEGCVVIVSFYQSIASQCGNVSLSHTLCICRYVVLRGWLPTCCFFSTQWHMKCVDTLFLCGIEAPRLTVVVASAEGARSIHTSASPLTIRLRLFRTLLFSYTEIMACCPLMGSPVTSNR